MVETPEAKEIHDITNQVATLLAAKDYDKLDDLAAKYRASKECYADGIWKLALVYDALVPSDKVPDAEWEARLAALRDWILAKPDSITPRVALAIDLTAYAWKARGGGWANSVTEEGWRLFEQRLNQAVDVLTQAKPLKEKCPQYWVVLMRAALGKQVNKTQFKYIFDQAINLEPDFAALYFRRAIYLLPRWYGDEGEWEKDLAQSADRIGGENGDMLYAQVVWKMHNYMNSKNIFKEANLSWARVGKGFDAIEKYFPNSLAAKNESAQLAGLAADKEKARKYFIQTEGKVDLSVWDDKDEFIKFANWAFYGQ